jgi:triosephosphate isomerase
MNDGNADELLSKTNVDGGLIGVAEKFAAIVKAASK